MDRREFLKRTGAAALAAGSAQGAGQALKLVVEHDAVTSSAPVQWALSELRKRVNVREEGAVAVIVRSDTAAKAESFSITSAKGSVLVRAGDPRGMMYALLDLAQRSGQVAEPIARIACQSGAQRRAVLRQRRGGQALVQRPRILAAYLTSWRRIASTASTSRSGSATISRARSATATFIFPIRFYGREGLSGPRQGPSGRRARSQFRDAEVHREGDGGARTAVPSRAVDPCLPVDR